MGGGKADEACIGSIRSTVLFTQISVIYSNRRMRQTMFKITWSHPHMIYKYKSFCKCNPQKKQDISLFCTSLDDKGFVVAIIACGNLFNFFFFLFVRGSQFCVLPIDNIHQYSMVKKTIENLLPIGNIRPQWH